ncbi:probable glycosyltransferase STELLO2 [Actinidia eriantha]|uniref:probable glycosyltransferase STELLO2 n=1 Tax=Actinidia eriantha TaxID=165200 RepID=UPI0025853914|nr:probable glycosyltransferase STELLO2 [Actinidia eriantha]
MLVQDRPTPKSPKTYSTRTLPIRFSESKTLDFSTWVSDNLYKIVAILLLIATVAALFFLRNVGDTAALLCFESQAQKLEKIDFPQIDWNSIEPITDKSSPYANFRSDQWIVVSVSDYPTDSLRKLARIREWQLLAIGNSKTPGDWNLRGTIFLSLEQQAHLGFRVVDFLPYDSYVRKTVGYLFAIQRGAKKIFDVDDRGDVIDNDISKHFDVELIGENARQEVILQYSHENTNRSVVNPYIHFGQRSVWPRGLPLENVGEIGHEEYYTEVFGGKQFIQQGISNGLPDVDSVFYFTRKSSLEAFDIRFDEHAPKVALPQGIMVPVNSFNTIYHSSAFWGLMLPVSVSSMASDVLRGYWGQRLLWEIGGYVVVYPPTVHRYDRIEAYPFSEEKDLHVNVGRLIKFLVSWRSGKHRLFEKILELSYAMAEEGFWTENDVKFTAAWLQDLLAVRYQQPRLMSLELDRPRASIGHGDRKDFVPRKLPSVHLAVEEIGTVNYEIGNLIRWRKNFGNVVLIMFCNGPVERTALEWRLLYGRIFKTVVILAEQKNVDLAVEEGHLDHLYKHLPSIFNRFSSAEGFLFLQDDTILNYWNLLLADKTKLWITDKVSESWTAVKTEGNTDWFTKQADMVKKVVSSMPVHFQVSFKESMTTDQSLTICNSEVFYIPRRFVPDFIDLVNLVGDLDIHQKVAIPMFFVSMNSPQNFDSVLGTMIYKQEPPSTNSSTFYSPEVPAIHPWSVLSEQEFIKLIRIMAAGDPLLMELV